MKTILKVAMFLSKLLTVKLLNLLLIASLLPLQQFNCENPLQNKFQIQVSDQKMAATFGADHKHKAAKVIDAHLHIWASPEQAAGEYPYYPGQKPTLRGDLDFLIQNLEEADVDGALIVQPIFHMFDHSLVTSALKKYPGKFVGCCLANPANDGSGIKQLEKLVLEDGYRAVRFNPELWPNGQKMTNYVGKALFSKAGQLGIPVGFLVTKGLNLYLSDIQELCTEFPSTTVLIDHLGYCKPPTNEEERHLFSELLKLSKFPQVYIKFSGIFRLSNVSFPYQDLVPHLSQVVASYGANRVMWGSDFPYVVAACGYKNGKEAAASIANQALSPPEAELIMGKTVMQLFKGGWLP